MYLQERNLYINEKNDVMIDLNTYRIFCLTKRMVEALQTEDGITDFDEDETLVWDKIHEQRNENSEEPSGFDTIKIHVSNLCNLSCKYCYAEGGNYGSKEAVMKKNVMDEIVDMIEQRDEFKNIKYITFFGGEPLLAWKNIRYICEQTKHKNMKYLLQTNGTVINDDIVELLKEYNITVTVSLDGPQHIHDYNRVDKHGNGTFEEVMKNIQYMQKEGIRIAAIQATISSEFARDYKKSEVADWIYQMTGVRRIKVEHDITGDTELADNMQEETETFFEGVFQEKYILDNDAFKIVSVILQKRYKDFLCSAGNRILTADVTGRLYPCQLFLGNKVMCLGKAGEELHTQPMDLLRKSKKVDCKNCFAKSTCYFCAANKIDEKKCELRRELTEHVLKYITELVYADKYLEFYDKFVKLYQ